MATTLDPIAFRRDGFAVDRAVFSKAEVARFRDLIVAVRQRATAGGLIDLDPNYRGLTMVRGDLLAAHELREVSYLAFDERVISGVRQLLGDAIVYHGDSTIQIGEGPRGFHKDNADRGQADGVDWQGEYGVLRLGIYLQDHAEASGGLKVRRCSHRYVSHHRGRSENLGTRAGDVAYWYLTTSHSGNFVRVRGMPWLSLHPRLETLVPKVLRVPEAEQRMAVFCTFAKPGVHLDHYIAYQFARPDVRQHWQYCGNGKSLTRLAADRAVTIRIPAPDFGQLAAPA